MQRNICLLATTCISTERKARSKFPIHSTLQGLDKFLEGPNQIFTPLFLWHYKEA